MSPGCFLPETDSELKGFLKNAPQSNWLISARNFLKPIGPDNFEAYRNIVIDKDNLIIMLFDKNQQEDGILKGISCEEKMIRLETFQKDKLGAIQSNLVIKNDRMRLIITEFSNDPNRELTKNELNQLHDELPSLYKFETKGSGQ